MAELGDGSAWMADGLAGDDRMIVGLLLVLIEAVILMLIDGRGLGPGFEG